MKVLVFSGLLLMGMSAAAYQNPDKIGECFVVGQAKQKGSCTVMTGGDVGSHYINLQFNHQEYLIEKSTSCGGNCQPYLGTIPEDVLQAKMYYRQYQTQQIMNKHNKNDWTCYKQIKGKLDVCYVAN
jgi:hypothetical protein